MLVRSLPGLLFALVAGFPVVALAVDASSPDDLCPAGADPCVIDRSYILRSFTFDFGSRELRIANGGSVQPDSFGNVDVLCGNFVVESGGTINLRPMPGFFHEVGSGMTIMARGTCTDAPAVACDDPGDCAAGDCVGGDVAIAGQVKGPAVFPGAFEVRARGNITTTGKYDLSRRGSDVSGGGWIGLAADGAIDATGSFRSRGGGRVELYGDAGVVVHDVKVDVSRGAYTHGQIVFESDADVSVSGTFKGRPGSSFDIDAGRDAFLSALSDGTETTLDLRGNRSWIGTGGSFDVDAGRDATIGSGVEIDQSYEGGSTAGSMSVRADRDLSFGATCSASSYVGMYTATGAISVTDTASFEIDQGEIGWDHQFWAATTLDFAGAFASTARAYPGELTLRGGSILLSGSIAQHGVPVVAPSDPLIWVYGCDVTLLPGATLASTAEGVGISILSGTIDIEAGSSLAATATGSIELDYSDISQPPVVTGNVSPAPVVTYVDGVGTCP